MSNEPWKIPNSPWKDEKAYLNWLRGSIRRIWSRHPVKISYKQQRRYKAPVGKNGKDVWVIDCEICGCPHRDTQTDHIRGGFGFNDWQSFTDWAKMILWVTFDDIRELCTSCHEAVTLSQKLGISFDEAVIQKEAISIIKSKKELSWLKERGIVPASNAEKRRKQIIEELSK